MKIKYVPIVITLLTIMCATVSAQTNVPRGWMDGGGESPIYPAAVDNGYIIKQVAIGTNTAVAGMALTVKGTATITHKLAVGTTTISATSALNVVGTVTATGYTGDGSGLTNVGGSGNMAAATYDPQTIAGDAFNLALHTGTTTDLRMGDTTFASQTGIVYKAGKRFIHNFNYGNNGTVTTTGYNTFVGEEAGNLTMGSTATAVGHASYNVGIGYRALRSNTTGNYNSAIGLDSLYANTTGSYNSAIGNRALYANTTGSNNNAIGFQALRSNTTGNYNSAIGLDSLYANTTGSYNSAIGNQSLYANTTGGSNNAIGFQAGRYIADGSTANATSTTSLYLGAETKAFASGDTNEIVIGYAATGIGSNTVVLGNGSITTTILRGNVGIGTTTPATALHVVGTVTATGYVGKWSPRIVSMTDGTSFTPTADTADINTHINTQAIGGLTANAPTGTHTDGQKLIIRLKSTNVQTYSWNAAYRFSASNGTVTVTSGADLTDYIGLMYNSTDSKWDVVSVSMGY